MRRNLHKPGAYLDMVSYLSTEDLETLSKIDCQYKKNRLLEMQANLEAAAGMSVSLAELLPKVESAMLASKVNITNDQELQE